MLIERTLREPENKLSASAMCQVAGVSRSGFYDYLKRANDPDSHANRKEEKDRKDFDLILDAYQFKGINKGSRGIHMRLLHMGVLMNRKKIQRLMRKYGLFCPIRKANPYRRMAKALKTSNYAANILQRQFEEFGPGYVLLTDITYFYYGRKRTRAYLSVIKDAFTKQILAYVLSPSMEEDFVLETVEMLYRDHAADIHTDALIHSDQGAHYTCIRFIDLLKDKKIRQSMSRRGNCWDNAPQESFFGHMKDEIGEHFEDISSFEELSKIIDDYIDYYNSDRYQYELAKLSPNEYLEYYKSGNYSLKDLIGENQKTMDKFASVRQNLKKIEISKIAGLIRSLA